MKLFISWSGGLSHQVALALRDWLPVVLPFVEPWVSSEDIPKGSRWGAQLWSELEGTDWGIACLVPDNLHEPWLIFEAGALSKAVQRARVHPFLLGVEPGGLTGGPLSQFQATRFAKDDVKKLVTSINAEAGDKSLPAQRLDRRFERYWAVLERRLTPLLELATKAKEASPSEKQAATAAPEPSFEILYSSVDPHHNYVDKGQGFTTRIFRIGVRNESSMTIRRVNVDVTKVEPTCPPEIHLPARLRLSNEAMLRLRRPEQSERPWSDEFPLDVGETQLVDVLLARDGSNNGFAICDLGVNWRHGLELGNYRLTIFVHGHEAQSAEAVFAFGRTGPEAFFMRMPE